MRASEFPSILPIPDFGFKASGVKVNPAVTTINRVVTPTIEVKSSTPESPARISTGGVASLKDIFKRVKEDSKQQNTHKELGENPFTLNDVKVALINFAKSHTTENELYIELSALKCELEGVSVSLIIDNRYSEQIVKPFVKRIEGALAEGVNNKHLTVELKYVESEKSNENHEKVPITAKEKLEYFIELNPCVADMVELLGLELE